MVWGFNTSTAPVHWAIAFGSSPCFIGATLLVIRSAIAALFALFCVVYTIDRWPLNGFRHFMYLTHWSLYLETIYLCILVHCTMLAQRHLQSNGALLAYGGGEDQRTLQQSASALEIGGPEHASDLGLPDAERPKNTHQADADGQPAIIRAMVALFHIVHPLSLFVVILYWTAVRPIWKVCAFSGGVEGCMPWPDFFNLFTHFFDWMILVFSLLVGRLPIYYSGAVWHVTFLVIYFSWTLVHFYLKIGVPPHRDCEKYPREECPIYNAVDWHDPMSVLRLSTALMFVGCPLFVTIYKGIVSLRDRFDRGIEKGG